MTTQVASPPAAAVPTRRRFTVAEYYAMADAGILSENDRVELLDGDPHRNAPNRTLARLQREHHRLNIPIYVAGESGCFERPEPGAIG